MVDEVCLNDALLSSAKEIFETMISMDIKESCKSEQDIENDAILGTITFTGSIEGCLAIYCDLPCAKAVSANMLALDSDAELSQEEVNDAIGEVANMVMGSVKSRILTATGDINISIPTVIRGQELNNTLGDSANKVSKKIDIADDYFAELSLSYRESNS